MGGANNMPTSGGNTGFFGGNLSSSGNVGGGKGTSQSTGYNPQPPQSSYGAQTFSAASPSYGPPPVYSPQSSGGYGNPFSGRAANPANYARAQAPVSNMGSGKGMSTAVPAVTRNAPSVNRAPVVEPPPPPPAPIAAPASDPSYSPYTMNTDTGMYQDSSGRQIYAFGEGGEPMYYNTEGGYGWKRGGSVKNLTDDVDQALHLVRNVVKKDKK
jgi:hypothetical protein